MGHHHQEQGKKQIWDFFHLLDGHQANILKYVTRAGKKQGESYEKDIKKAIDYAAKAKETATPIRVDLSCIVVRAVNIANHIERFQDEKYASILCMVLCKKYTETITLLNLLLP